MKASRKRLIRPIPSILLLTMLTLPIHVGCNGTETSSVAAPIRMSRDVEQVRAWLCGGFESEMPTTRDAAAVRFEWNACPIWPDRQDGRWLYAERATVGATSRPDARNIHRIRNDAQGGLLAPIVMHFVINAINIALLGRKAAQQNADALGGPAL